jgi:hypothetical protein
LLLVPYDELDNLVIIQHLGEVVTKMCDIIDFCLQISFCLFGRNTAKLLDAFACFGILKFVEQFLLVDFIIVVSNETDDCLPALFQCNTSGIDEWKDDSFYVPPGQSAFMIIVIMVGV